MNGKQCEPHVGVLVRFLWTGRHGQFRCVQSVFVALLHILVLDQTKQCRKIWGGWDTVFVVFQKPRYSPMSTPSSDLAIRILMMCSCVDWEPKRNLIRFIVHQHIQ